MDATKLANLIFIAAWVALTGLVLAFGQRWSRLAGFRACMLEQWKPALAISLLFLLGMGLGGRGFLNPYALAVFCQAMVGLALVRGIPRYEPFPVTAAVSRRERIGRTVALTLLWTMIATAAAFLIGSVGMSIGQQIFHETNRSREAVSSFPASSWQVFWLFLSGAGIAEETMYRLVVIGLVWRLTRRPGWAVFLAALLFGAYHLIPLNGMYQTFLQFPVSQFLASLLIGLVWGWLFVRRGYESAVLAHTLSNWVPMLLFT